MFSAQAACRGPTRTPSPENTLDETHCALLLTNIAVVVSAGHSRQPAGREPLPDGQRPEPGGAAGLCLHHGLYGAIISLLMSKPMAKMSMGVQIINEPRNQDEPGSSRPCAALPTRPAYRCPRSASTRATRTPCHRRLQELGPGGRVHRPLAGHDARGGRGRHRPRGYYVANGDMVTMALIQG